MNDDMKNKNISSADFEFMQAGEKIYDKKFETKPIGYFKDAMIRFRKNRTNVVATAILFVIIALTVIIPLISTKNFTVLESELAFLPPRIPGLAQLGIMDGTSKKESIPADINELFKSEKNADGEYILYKWDTTDNGADGVAGNEDDADLYWVVQDQEGLVEIDTEFELYLPTTYPANVLDLNTLENVEQMCTDKSDLCQGGETVISTDAGATHVYVDSTSKFFFVKTDNPTLEVVVDEFVNNNNSELKVLIQTTFGGEWEEAISITEAGTYTIDIFETFNVASTIGSNVRFELISNSKEDKVMLTSVAMFDDTSLVDLDDVDGDGDVDELIPTKIDDGYELASYVINTDDDSAGLLVRRNGTIIMTNFKYLNYVAALGNQDRVGFPSSEFDELVAANGDCMPIGVTTINSSADYIGEYPATCAIVEVYGVNDPVTIDGVEYFSYDLTLNYQLYKGYEEMPYFYFGTDFNGRDLFTLLWVATRTSLLIGVVVAAINVSVGIVYGAIAGYYGGTTDIILQRFAEIIGRIPWLVTLSIFVSFFGPGLQTLILILIVSGWIGPQSVTRTQFYRYKGREYVLASRTLGAKDSRLIFRHILPNGIGTIITSSILMIPYTIFSESTISYLGFGVGHGQEFNIFGITFSGVSVGVLLSDGRNYLLDRPYLTIFPSLLISVLMITFNMFGNALRDAFNPALRGSE